MTPNIKPRLSQVSPIVYWISWGYFLTNILIGISFFLLYRPVVPILIVTDLFSFRFWGALFILLGLSMACGLWRNLWPLIKFSLLAGILVKVAWEVALLERVLHDPSAFSIAVIWLFFTYIQFLCFVFFIPEGA